MYHNTNIVPSSQNPHESDRTNKYLRYFAYFTYFVVYTKYPCFIPCASGASFSIFRWATFDEEKKWRFFHLINSKESEKFLAFEYF